MYSHIKRYNVSVENSEDVIGWVGFDTSEDEPTQLFFCPLRLHDYTPTGVMCLALAPAASSAAKALPNSFRRVGIGKIEYPDDLDAFELGEKCYEEIFESCQRSELLIV